MPSRPPAALSLLGALLFSAGCSGSSGSSSSSTSGSSGGSTSGGGTTGGGSTGSSGTSGTSGGLSEGEASLTGTLAWAPASSDLALINLPDGGASYLESQLVVEIDGEASPDCHGRGAPPGKPLLLLHIASADGGAVAVGSYAFADGALAGTDLDRSPDGGSHVHQSPTAGTVSLTQLGTDAAGSFSLTFAGGDTLAGSFNAASCNP